MRHAIALLLVVLLLVGFSTLGCSGGDSGPAGGEDFGPAPGPSARPAPGGDEGGEDEDEGDEGDEEEEEDEEEGEEEDEEEYDEEEEEEEEYDEEEEEEYDEEEGEFGEEGGAARQPAPENYAGWAELAFRQGRDGDAIQYLFAWALTNDAEGLPILKTMRWVPALRRPALAVRWGIGVDYDGPTRAAPRRSASRGFDEEGDGEGGGVRPAVSAGGGLDQAGELANQVLAYLEGRVARAYYGQVLADAYLKVGRRATGRAARPAARGYDSEGEEEEEFEEEGEEEEESYEEEEEGGPIRRRPMMRGGAGGPAGAASSGGLMPGVTSLGQGKIGELLDRAQAEKVDVLLVLDVRGRMAPLSRVITKSGQVALYDVATRKRGVVSRSMRIVAPSAARGASDPYAGLKEVFEFADQHYKMTDPPETLTPEAVLSRVSTLSGQQYANPLPVLAEIKFYAASGLLPQNELLMAFEKICGQGVGAQLLTADEETRKTLIAQWLPGGGAGGPAQPGGRALPALPPLR